MKLGESQLMACYVQENLLRRKVANTFEPELGVCTQSHINITLYCTGSSSQNEVFENLSGKVFV
jgi:hypothetical protein